MRLLPLFIALFLWLNLSQASTPAEISALKTYAEKHCSQNTPHCLPELLQYGFTQSRSIADLNAEDRSRLLTSVRFIAQAGNIQLAQTLRNQYFTNDALFEQESILKIHATLGQYDKVKQLIKDKCQQNKTCIGEQYNAIFLRLSFGLKPAEDIIHLAKQSKQVNGALRVADRWLKHGRKNEATKLIHWSLEQNEHPQWGATQTPCTPCYYDFLKAAAGLDKDSLIQAINTFKAEYYGFRHASSITDGFIQAKDKDAATHGLNVLISAIARHPGETFADSGHPWRGDAHRYVSQTLSAYLKQWSDASIEKQLALWLKQLDTGKLDYQLIAADLVSYYIAIKRFDLAYKILFRATSRTERLLMQLARYDHRPDSPIDRLLRKADQQNAYIVAAQLIRKLSDNGTQSDLSQVIDKTFSRMDDDKKSVLSSNLSQFLEYLTCTSPEAALRMASQYTEIKLKRSSVAFQLAIQGKWQESLEFTLNKEASLAYLLERIAKLYYVEQRRENSYYWQRFQCQ